MPIAWSTSQTEESRAKRFPNWKWKEFIEMQTRTAVLTAIALLGVAAGVLRSSLPKSGPDHRAAASTPVQDRKMVVAPGYVEPASEEVKLGSELDGKLRSVMVDEGDRVTRGQVVAVLENADYAAR